MAASAIHLVGFFLIRSPARSILYLRLLWLPAESASSRFPTSVDPIPNAKSFFSFSPSLLYAAGNQIERELVGSGVALLLPKRMYNVRAKDFGSFRFLFLLVHVKAS